MTPADAPSACATRTALAARIFNPFPRFPPLTQRSASAPDPTAPKHARLKFHVHTSSIPAKFRTQTSCSSACK